MRDTTTPIVIGKELQELHRAVAGAHAEGSALDVAREALRAAALAVNQLTSDVAALQKEAQDVEHEEVPPTVRAFVDGSLLQRTRYVLSRTTTIAHELRMLSQGVRDLEADCDSLDGTLRALAGDPPSA